MRRLICLVLVLALAGCGAVPTVSNVTVEALAEARDFGGFTASPPADGESAQILVRSVLEEYPAGFAEQWGNVQILLVCNLQGTDTFAGGDYAGFTQRVGDGWRMVLDVDRVTATTVHHEIAHILDGILTEAGLLTEDGWMAYCPGSFAYGDQNWADYPDFFVDAYAMTDIREDRAATFAEAIRRGPGAYADSPALWLKLSVFSEAIREWFDTEGWPEKTIWEMGLT